MDYTVHGILQARILEWGAFPFSRELKAKNDSGDKKRTFHDTKVSSKEREVLSLSAAHHGLKYKVK